MRIISSFRDYYDSVQSLGQDDLVYLREERKVVAELDFDSVRSFWDSVIGYRHRIIGFCGRIYSLIIFDPQKLSGSENVPDKYNCYTIDDIDLCLETYGKKKAKQEYYDRCGYGRSKSSLRSDFVENFNYFNTSQMQHRFVGYFTQFASPIFTVRRLKGNDVEFTINAALAKYDFVRVKDVYTAFQDVSMFVGNIATPEKPIPTIDDKTMASIKGFDKFSFRKEKTGS